MDHFMECQLSLFPKQSFHNSIRSSRENSDELAVTVIYLHEEGMQKNVTVFYSLNKINVLKEEINFIGGLVHHCKGSCFSSSSKDQIDITNDSKNQLFITIYIRPSSQKLSYISLNIKYL